MQKIFMVRHGETDWNLEMRFQGKENIPLNKTGISQAWLLAQKLSKEKFSAVYSSPLARAQTTAEIIAGINGLTPCVVEGLSEICFGTLEGKNYAELTENERSAVDQWMVSPETGTIPCGETFKQFKERILASYENLLSADQETNFVIVTHAGAIKVLVSAILEVPFSRLTGLKVSPGSLTTILYDSWRNAYLELFNDVCHLQQ